MGQLIQKKWLYTLNKVNGEYILDVVCGGGVGMYIVELLVIMHQCLLNH
jgi:hypothetical protein